MNKLPELPFDRLMYHVRQPTAVGNSTRANTGRPSICAEWTDEMRREGTVNDGFDCLDNHCSEQRFHQ